MKIFTRILVFFILIFGLVITAATIFEAKGAIVWNAFQIAFGSIIILIAIILKRDRNLQFFASISDTMFQNNIQVSGLLDEFYYHSLKLGRRLIIVGVIVIIAPAYKIIYVVEAVIFIVTLFKYIQLFYKLSLKYNI